MSEQIKTSLLWRMIAALYAWYRRTPLARAVDCVARLWRESGTYRLFRRLLCGADLVERSNYRRLLDRFNASLCRLGVRIMPAVRASLSYRIYAALFSALRRSFFIGGICRGGMTSLLLCVVALFAPIDWILRTVPGLTAVAGIWDDFFLIFALLWVLLRRASTKKPLPSRANLMDVYLAFYLLAGAVLLLFTVSNLGVNIEGYRASMEFMLMFFVVTRLLRDEKDFRFLYTAMLAVAFLIALHGIWQFVVGAPIPSNWVDGAEESVRTRVYSIFNNPNVMGAYMALFAPMAIGAAYASEDTATKVFYWFCGICMCFACLFTMSRGAWLALAIAAVVFSIAVDRKLFFLLLAGGIASCFLPFVRSRIGYLFTTEFALSNARGGRSVRWETAMGYLDQYDSWTLGLGYGIYGGAVAENNQFRPELVYMYVDNYYIKILVENGIIGLGALLTMLGGLFWNGTRACAKANRNKPLCVGMLAGLIAVLVQSLFESLWEVPYIMAIFFAVAGMLIFAGLLRGQPQRKEEDR